MSFSRLLLAAANSKKYISGEGNDKVQISPKFTQGRDGFEGEVILCFQLDERTDQGKQIAHNLGIPPESKRCDGLVFYAQDGKPERIICLVEMKRTDITDAQQQIIAVKEHILQLLYDECNALPEKCQDACRKQIRRIVWKACLYHHSTSPEKIYEFQRDLRNQGFSDVDHLDITRNDLRPLLSGEGRSAKEMVQSLKKRQKGRRK